MNLILQPPFADRAIPPFCRQSRVGNPAEVGHEMRISKVIKVNRDLCLKMRPVLSVRDSNPEKEN